MSAAVFEESTRGAAALSLHQVTGVRSRGPTWKHGPLAPAASPLAAELLRGVVACGLVAERREGFSLSELLVVRGWSRFATVFTSASFRVVLQRGTEATRLRRLTRREFDVSCLVARGYPSKHVGALLSIAPATARGATQRSLMKLGLASTLQLPLLWHTLAGPCTCFREAGGVELFMFQSNLRALSLQRLTTVERLLTIGLLSGDRNSDIAQRRGVSVRTVANQMAALYRKLGVSSRAELVVRLLESTSSRPPSGC